MHIRPESVSGSWSGSSVTVSYDALSWNDAGGIGKDRREPPKTGTSLPVSGRTSFDIVVPYPRPESGRVGQLSGSVGNRLISIDADRESVPEADERSLVEFRSDIHEDVATQNLTVCKPD